MKVNRKFLIINKKIILILQIIFKLNTNSYLFILNFKIFIIN